LMVILEFATQGQRPTEAIKNGQQHHGGVQQNG
jgi:hypothetical protein